MHPLPPFSHLQFAPAPPPYCCDDESPASSSGAWSTPASPACHPGLPASASRRMLEGVGVAALLHQDGVSASGGSFSGGLSGAARTGASPQARPQTAPAQRGQQAAPNFPWN